MEIYGTDAFSRNGILYIKSLEGSGIPYYGLREKL